MFFFFQYLCPENISEVLLSHSKSLIQFTNQVKLTTDVMLNMSADESNDELCFVLAAAASTDFKKKFTLLCT